jgi:hypothetical protein
MRRRLVAGIVGVSMLVAGMAAPVVAAEHLQMGTPGTPNCVGQTAAYYAEYAKLWYVSPGVGNDAKVQGVSVQDLMRQARAYCGRL